MNNQGGTDMPATLDKEKAENVKTQQNAAAIIRNIVENQFGGKFNIDWVTETLNIDVPDDKKMDCAIAIEKAMAENNCKEVCDMDEKMDTGFFITGGDPNKPAM